MRYLSLFSGIEAASAAWHSLGWTCAAVAEIDTFPSNVIEVRFPGVPNLGDLTKVTEAQIKALGRLDLIVFGSPCQDLSVAGKRKGLDGARSGLFFTAMQIIGWAREHCGLRWALWENVPGAFTSSEGRDFAAVVEHMAGLDAVAVPPKGWGNEGCAVGEEGMVEWATLDAQWFGVAQRRRRVFALADFGDWSGRPPVLLESQSVRGDSAPSRGTGEDAPAGTLRSTDGGCDVDHARAGHLVASPVCPTLRAGGNSTGGDRPPGTDVDTCESFIVQRGRGPICVSNAEGSTGLPFLTVSNLSKTVNNQTPLIAFSCKDHGGDASVEVSPTLRAMGHGGSHANAGGQVAVCGVGDKVPSFKWPLDVADSLVCGEAKTYTNEGSTFRLRNVVPDVTCVTGDVTHALNTANNGKGSSEDGTGRVRRLTPRECERLQAFPDDHTLITVRGKPAADGPRYKALGNSMCVNVMHWIGRRIDFVHSFFGPAEEEDLFA